MVCKLWISTWLSGSVPCMLCIRIAGIPLLTFSIGLAYIVWEVLQCCIARMCCLYRRHIRAHLSSALYVDEEGAQSHMSTSSISCNPPVFYLLRATPNIICNVLSWLLCSIVTMHRSVCISQIRNGNTVFWVCAVYGSPIDAFVLPDFQERF